MDESIGLKPQSKSEPPNESDPTEMINAEMRVLGFHLGTQHFGVDVDVVVEIIRQVEVTELPESPDFVEGIIDVRGRIIPLIKLRTLLRLEEKACDPDTEIIIAAVQGTEVGLIVDSVTEIIPFKTDKILPLDSTTLPLAKYLCGTADLGQELILLLDINKITDFAQIAVPEGEKKPRRKAKEPQGDTDREKEILHKRAVELRKKAEEDNTEKRQLVTFTLGSEWYALDIDRVREISPLFDIYHIPGAPHHIVGTINLRGVIISVIDLRTFFELPEARFNPDASIIVVELNHTKVGLIVDSVADIVDLPDKSIEPPLATLDRLKADYLFGEADWDDRLFGLLNLENIIFSITQSIY